MPRRAPELLNGQIGRKADLHAQHPKGEVMDVPSEQPEGAPQGCGALPKGQEAPFGDPVQKRGAQGISGIRVAC